MAAHSDRWGAQRCIECDSWLPLQVMGAKKCAQLARCKAWEPRPPSTARGAAAIAEKQKRAPTFAGALWLPNGHGGRSAPGGRSSKPSVAQASALRKRTARRKDANAKRAFSVQSRVGQKRKSTYFHRCSVVAQRARRAKRARWAKQRAVRGAGVGFAQANSAAERR